MTALTDPIPLRQNLAWGQFAATASPLSNAAVYIPHRYGICGGTLIQYDKQRTQFVWADHAVESIDAVLVNGVAAQGWTWANTLDVTGHAIALVTMQQPIDQGATIIARGKGKLHPVTGARMTNSAAILWDVLANIAGRDLAESALQTFAAECHARGLEAGGSVEKADLLGAITLSICSSVGAVFSSGGLAAIYPGGAASPSLYTIDTKPGIAVTASARLSDVLNDITIRYAFEAGSPRQSLQLDCPASVTRFGRRPQIIDAPWCASPRTAYDVAVRVLQLRARAQWAVHADGLRRAVKIGQTVTLAHPVCPVSADLTVVGTEYAFATGLTAADIVAPAGSVQRTRIVQQSESFDSQSAPAINVQTVGNLRILTIVDTDGVTPLPGASVTLDGRITHFTDSSGRVTFSVQEMTAGEHTLLIVAVDGRQLTLQVLV